MKKSTAMYAVMATVCFCNITSAVAEAVSFDLTGRLGYWASEQKFDGIKINEEAGPLIGVEGTLGLKPAEILILEARGAIDIIPESGTVYSDGFGVPQGTDYTITQVRFKGEGTAGLNLGNNSAHLMPFGGLGFRVWSWGDPDPALFVIESWSGLYGVIGLRGDVLLGNTELYGRIAVQLPLKETVSVEGYEEDLEDDTTAMIEAEVGFISGKLIIALWGEWFEYSADYSTTQYNFGEDITAGAVGVKLGIAL